MRWITSGLVPSVIFAGFVLLIRRVFGGYSFVVYSVKEYR